MLGKNSIGVASLSVLLGAAVIAAAVVAGTWYSDAQLEERLNQLHHVDVGDVPMPFPLTPEEIAELRQPRVQGSDSKREQSDESPEPSAASGSSWLQTARQAARDPLVGISLDALAMTHAVARGARYMKSRVTCHTCHGSDLAGKTLFDDSWLGTWNAPNITRSGVTQGYTIGDWVRLLRHGIKRDGTAAVMPVHDSTWLSDQEISDIAMFVVNQPRVTRDVPPSHLGPLFALRIVTGTWRLPAESNDPTAARPTRPPSALSPSVELGRHLANSCRGCHGPAYSGGTPTVLGWRGPAASNLTFHETGLASWSLSDFQRALTDGARPDGSPVDESVRASHTRSFDAVEFEALYRFLASLEKRPFGETR